MSFANPLGRPVETGETIARYRSYDEAQKAVSTLIAADVPARDIAIVGTELRSVEKVTGRLGWAQAAWSGAVNGMLIGLLLVALSIIWTPTVNPGVMAGMVLFGVAIGMVMRLVTYALVRRRRDFASTMQVSAQTFEVTVLPGSIIRAREALGTRPAAPAQPDPARFEPPRYGVRIDTADQPMSGSGEAETTPPPRETEQPPGV